MVSYMPERRNLSRKYKMYDTCQFLVLRTYISYQHTSRKQEHSALFAQIRVCCCYGIQIDVQQVSFSSSSIIIRVVNNNNTRRETIMHSTLFAQAPWCCCSRIWVAVWQVTFSSRSRFWSNNTCDRLQKLLGRYSSLLTAEHFALRQFGIRDTPTTAIQLASLSKQFCNLTVLVLELRGYVQNTGVVSNRHSVLNESPNMLAAV